MPIRFKCPNCKKALAVKEQMAGKKAACPACKKPLQIPAPISNPRDVEDFAANLLAEAAAPKAELKPTSTQTIDFTCPFCDAELHLSAELGGKREPCPECKNIIKVPQLVKEQAKDWRSVEKTGPSGAATKGQQELEGAWGSTTNKGKVSTETLEKAGAIVYEDDEETSRLGRWLKRLSIWGGIAGLIVLAVWGINRRKDNNLQKDSLAHALEIAGKAKGKDRLPAAWNAQIHRAAGEFSLRKRDKVKQTLIYLKLARNPLFVRPEDKELPLDFDLALTALILNQTGLAGTPEEVDDKLRLDWNDVHEELFKSLQKIRPTEAKVLALRAMADKLVAQKQGFQALVLARRLYDLEKKRELLAQWVAFAHDPNMQDKKANVKAEAAKALPPPNPEQRLDGFTRTAYAEGLAREGNLAEGLTIAQAPGKPQDRMQAALAVAKVAKDKSPAESGLKFALDLANGDLKDIVPPWLALQLVQATLRANLIDQAKEIAKKLPADFKSWAELEIFQATLAKNQGLAQASEVEQIGDPNSLARALAWEAWARHNTRLDFKNDVDLALETLSDQRFRPFIEVGIALGVQDRNGK